MSAQLRATSRRVSPLHAATISQEFTYHYEAPISDLSHRALILPPSRRPGQRLVSCHVDISADGDVAHRLSTDVHGNRAVVIRASRVDSHLTIRSTYTAVRSPGPTATRLTAVAQASLLIPTPLTLADADIRTAATRLLGAAGPSAAFATACAEYVGAHLAYTFDVTTTASTAVDVHRLGAGICQDYAHLMVALCLAAGIRARYVSGHIPGPGNSHAWVEVLLPRPHNPGVFDVCALDPTNGCAAGAGHISVAAGPDYAAVAPMSGRYRGARGRLTSTKEMVVTLASDVEVVPGVA